VRGTTGKTRARTGTKAEVGPGLLPADALAGQVAVVTGGGRGLGRALSLSLAAAGASVAIVARSLDHLTSSIAAITASGGKAAAFAVDVTNEIGIERVSRRIESEVGPVDILVNNAGMGPPYGPVREIDPEEWWRCIEVNVRGPLLCTRAFLPGMVARRRGRIVNIASGAGTKAIPNLSAYAVAKTAVIRFTEILAAESRESGISVFAIEPGTTRSGMTEAALASPEARKWLPWLERIFDERRDVTPDGAAALVNFLASGKADALTGRFITVDDDLASMIRRAKEIEAKDFHTLRLRTS